MVGGGLIGQETKGLQKDLVDDLLLARLLKNKILSFRDILDLPPWHGSSAFHEVFVSLVYVFQWM